MLSGVLDITFLLIPLFIMGFELFPQFMFSSNCIVSLQTFVIFLFSFSDPTYVMISVIANILFEQLGVVPLF